MEFRLTELSFIIGDIYWTEMIGSDIYWKLNIESDWNKLILKTIRNIPKWLDWNIPTVTYDKFTAQNSWNLVICVLITGHMSKLSIGVIGS